LPIFIATCAKGLVEVLEQELSEIGVKPLERLPGGVRFESNWEGCYKANLYSRIASRILKPVLDFTAYEPEELYRHVQRHDFTKYISPKKTIRVEASVSDSKIHDQRFLAMKTKDAIVDQFRDKFGERPNVENENPDLRVFIRGSKNQFQIAIDTSGDSLYLRGYRRAAGPAPLKENLAAALLSLAGWQKDKPVIDPMCGSGTILIEAAMMALQIAPGTLRRKFGFENFEQFDRQVWMKIVDEAIDKELQELPFQFYGFDTDKRILLTAKENAKRAGVADFIEFRKEDVATLRPPVEQGVVITNPPYAMRMGDEENVMDVYRDLGHTLKSNFKGWDAWILSGNKDLILHLKLKASRKVFLFNGPLECRFLKYSLR
jgi:23S rRNA G2445 N2-methylase RlmL